MMDGDSDDIIELTCGPCCGQSVRIRRGNFTRLMRALWFRRSAVSGALDFRRVPPHIDLLSDQLTGRDIGDLARAVYVPDTPEPAGSG